MLTSIVLDFKERGSCVSSSSLGYVTSHVKMFLAVSVQTAKCAASGQIKTGRKVVLTGGVND